MAYKTSVLISKVKGHTKAINLLKHSFRETKDLEKNIFKSKTNLNFYWINNKFYLNNQQNKADLMKDLLLNKIAAVKKQFENDMFNKRADRKTTWQGFTENRNIMQEVLVNVSPQWWEEKQFVKYHEELFYDQENERVDKMKWGIKEIFNSENLKAWGESQIAWIKQELKDTYGNDKNFLGASLHVDEKTPHIHLFLSTVDLSFDKRKDKEVFKLSTSPFSRNRFQILQTSIWKWNQKYWDKKLVRGLSKKSTNYKYKSLADFRSKTNLKIISNYLEIEKTKQNWRELQQGWILNNKKIQDLMRDMIVYKSVNKEAEYQNAKQELSKLGLNLSQTKEIENFVNRVIERS